jgi:hypothetical protein
MNQSYQVAYWKERFGVSEEDSVKQWSPQMRWQERWKRTCGLRMLANPAEGPRNSLATLLRFIEINAREAAGASYFAPLSHRHFFGRRRTRLASTTESDSSRSRSPLRDQAHDVADESS